MKKRQTRFVFKRIPTIKDQAARTELGRAHLLVALLAFALFLTLVMSLEPDYTPNAPLTLTASVLLILVGLFSLAVAARLYGSKK